MSLSRLPFLSCFLAGMLLLAFDCTLLGHTAADEQISTSGGVYLTKSEFDTFLRQYHERQAETGRTINSQHIDTKKFAWKKGSFTITPYGYVNLSLSYDSQKANSGDYCAFVYSPDQDDASACQVDAKSSRFGFLIESPGIPGWRNSKTQGYFEFDFQGPLSVRSRPGFMMRKAYVAVSDKNTKLLAGQDWEVISPLFPKTLNYTAGAAVGNNGYRRAMLKLEHRFDLTQSTDLLFQFALADNVLRDASGVSWCSVAVGRWPVLQGRVAYAFAKNRHYKDLGLPCDTSACQEPNCGVGGESACAPCTDAGAKLDPITLGFSAHLGEQRFDFRDAAPGGSGREYIKTWSLNADLDIPVSRRLRFQAEYFLGENLSGVEGGIMQGVDVYRREAIRSQGGWAGIQYLLTKKLQTNVCFLIDDPFNDDLLGGSDSTGQSRTYNHCLFTNLLYNWTPALMTGFEVSFWRTHWQQYDATTGVVSALQPGKSTRLEFVTRYTF